MSEHPSPLQTFLQHLPDIIKSLPALKSLFERKKLKEGLGEPAAETILSIEDLSEIDIYIVGNIKTFKKTFRVVKAPCKKGNTVASIACDQRADVTLETEHGNTASIQTPGIGPMEVQLDQILAQLQPDTVFWLESNVEIDPRELIKQHPSQLMPTKWRSRDSTTLTFTNTSSFPIRNLEWPLPLQELYPIHRFQVEKGGQRISNQLIQIGLRWIETLGNEDLQELGGYEDDDSVLDYFKKNRKQGPTLALSIHIGELGPKESVTLTIFHSPPRKDRLGFRSGQ